ncbi:MAG: hypothetical protein H0T73_14725 [Ardenticatenales bacterium]|nr:hypothetical protein [Ardenticatenales bacterium]
MNELQAACRMISNADLDVEFLKDFPFVIRLTFQDYGSDKRLVFYCGDIALLHIDKDPDAVPSYPCLELRVSEPIKKWPSGVEVRMFKFMPQEEHKDYLWHLEISAEAYIIIECLYFRWEVLQVLKEETL